MLLTLMRLEYVATSMQPVGGFTGLRLRLTCVGPWLMALLLAQACGTGAGATKPSVSAIAAEPSTTDPAATESADAAAPPPDRAAQPADPVAADESSPSTESQTAAASPSLAPDVQISAEQGLQNKREACRALKQRVVAGAAPRLLVQTLRPHPEADRAAAVKACERVLRGLAASDRTAASPACDLGMFTVTATVGLLQSLCANRLVYMVNEDQPAFAQ